MSVRVRAVSGFEDIERWVAARNAVRPDDAWTPQMLALFRAQEVDRLDLLATLDDEVVGTAFVAGSPVSTPERAFAELLVTPGARRHGVGRALLESVVGDARSRACRSLELFVRAEERDAVSFVEHRGFALLRTLDWLARDLAAPAPTPRPLQEGIQLAWLSERPQAVEAMYVVARETYTELEQVLPHIVSTLHDWEAFELGDPKVTFDLCSIALAGDDVVGYGVIQVAAGSKLAMHRMTAVRPAWRRRGIGEAMTCAQIVAAQQAGLDVLRGWARTDEIRRLALRLGYAVERSLRVYRLPL
jgi:ribosomal-protein-alanine N-acetyltransferase